MNRELEVKQEAAAFSLRKVRFEYRRKRGFLSNDRYPALHDVSFTLYRGDSLAIVGRNGAGKSTLLRVLAGIIKPTSGSITNYGCQTALLSLQTGFDRHLSGRDNAILNGLFLGIPKERTLECMDDIVALSQLRDFIDEPVRHYSTGMRARLGFAVAANLDPDVLLLDEVLAVGDAEFKKKSQEVMRRRLESNRTIVLVSHQAQTVRQLCNRAVWLEDGRTLAEGEAGYVLKQYESCTRSGSALRGV